MILRWGNLAAISALQVLAPIFFNFYVLFDPVELSSEILKLWKGVKYGVDFAHVILLDR